MTKRFRYDTGCVIDQLENKVLSERQAVNHLNALHEENEQLKQENNNLRIALRYELEKDLPSAPVGHCRCTPEPYGSDDK